MRRTILVLTFLALALVVQAFQPQPTTTDVKHVRVCSGQTIWEIAEEYYNPKEVRCFEEFVYDIRKDNNLLGNNMLQAGQMLKIRIVKSE